MAERLWAMLLAGGLYLAAGGCGGGGQATDDGEDPAGMDDGGDEGRDDGSLDADDGASDGSADGEDDAADGGIDTPPPVVDDGAPTPELIAQLADQRSRQKAVDALIVRGKPAVPDIVMALDDPKPEVRAAAAFALGQIGDKAALTPLKNRLESEQDDASASAIKFAIEAIGER